MTKKAYHKIAAGLTDALAFAKGEADPKAYKVHVPEEIDVRQIRERLQLSQTEFGARFGFGVANVRDWEQKRARPSAAARTLLLVIKHEPQAVDRALHAEASPAE